MWGAVDGVIAGAGTVLMRRRRSGLTDPDAADVLAEERRRLHRLLVVNAALDVAYVAGGTALALAAGRLDRQRPGRGPRASGNGVAIVVQGAFLLVLDTTVARRLAGP